MKEKEKKKACYMPPYGELLTLGVPNSLLINLSMESAEVLDYGEEDSD